MSFNYQKNSTDSNIYADERTSNYYSSKASELVEKYYGTDDLYSNLFVKYLSPGSNILDIGYGSGRDILNLLKAGFIVTGADSSDKMIEASVNKYPELAGKISFSGLPELPGIDNTFSGVLCSAVLQHIPDSNLNECFQRISELLQEEGIFIVSFPVEYPGIDPRTNRDAWGRLFYIRSAEKYRFLIESMGFSLIKGELQDDTLGRDANWCVQVWSKQYLSKFHPNRTSEWV